MEEQLIIVFITILLFGLGILIKYFKAYQLISGYNTLSPEVKEQVDAKALGDFSGRQLMIMSVMPLLGYLLKKAGFLWGVEVGFGLMVIIALYTAIKSKKFIPPHDRNKSARIGVLLSIIITTAVVAVVAWTIMPADFNLESDQLKIEGAYGVNIKYSEIESLKLKNEIPEFTLRTNGAQLGPIARGHFNLSDGRKALVFLSSAQAPVIIIERKNAQEAVIINFKDPATTSSLYEQLDEKV